MLIPLSTPPSSKDIAQLLRAVAAVYVIEGASRFRISAYQKAADSVEQASREIYDIWQDNQLQKLPGIGGSIGEHLSELFEKGESKYFEDVFEKMPPGMFALLPVPGIGPKHAYKLALELGLVSYETALDDLVKAANEGKITEIEGFREDSVKKFLQGIEELRNQSDRMLLHVADGISEQILTYLRDLPEVIRAEPLGSQRRRGNTVGDLDFAAATNEPEKVIEHFVNYPESKYKIEAGTMSASIMLKNNVHVDLLVQDEGSFGALLQHFTGSKHHNIRLRERALKKGWSLSEKGIQIIAKKELKEFATEEAFYEFMGLDWVPPELREDHGEIELAEKGKLPKLVERKDLKGEFHLHSDFPIEPSHDVGQSSMEELLDKAAGMGYEYLGFAEHNPSISGHSVSQVFELVKRKKEQVYKINERRENEGRETVKGFNSMEIDIRPDGGLALPEEALELLDFGIVSIHSSFNQSREETTKRVLAALEHPKVKIFGHPTGRLINQRQGVEMDWEALFDFCVKHEKWLDIDGWPDRRDLPEDQIREAVKYGVKFVISSDAHRAEDLDMIRYGIDTARRGWVEKGSVVNCLGLEELEKLLGE